MPYKADLVRPDAMVAHQRGNPIRDRLRRIGRRGRQLEVPQHPRARVMQSEIGECAADVDTDANHAAPMRQPAV